MIGGFAVIFFFVNSVVVADVHVIAQFECVHIGAVFHPIRQLVPWGDHPLGEEVSSDVCVVVAGDNVVVVAGGPGRSINVSIRSKPGCVVNIFFVLDDLKCLDHIESFPSVS